MTVQATIERETRGRAAGLTFVRRPAPSASCPLVLLHGIGSNAASFGPLMAALPMSFDVVAWNAPGYETSQPLSQVSPSPRDYAAALAHFLDALGLTRVVLCGHSLGALFAASFTAFYPGRVAALALFSPALGYRVAPGAALPPAVQARIEEVQSGDLDGFAAKRAVRLVHAPERKTDVVAAVEKAMRAVNPGGYIQAVRALGAGDLLADAKGITVPALVAVGAQDLVTPPANARAVYQALARGTRFHEVADCGHALPQENPAAAAALLSEVMEHADG